jgi:hypothetical protein
MGHVLGTESSVERVRWYDYGAALRSPMSIGCYLALFRQGKDQIHVAPDGTQEAKAMALGANADVDTLPNDREEHTVLGTSLSHRKQIDGH